MRAYLVDRSFALSYLKSSAFLFAVASLSFFTLRCGNSNEEILCQLTCQRAGPGFRPDHILSSGRYAPSCNVQLSYYRRQLQTGYQNFWSETVFADFL